MKEIEKKKRKEKKTVFRVDSKKRRLDMDVVCFDY